MHMHFMDERQRNFLPTYIYVDTFIGGGCRKPCSLESLSNQISFYLRTCIFVFNAYLMFLSHPVSSEFTMLIHTKCVTYPYAFH